MNDSITTTPFTIIGMTCSHCVSAVTEEVCKLDGVTGVYIDLATGTATVESTGPIGQEAVAAAVAEAGYEVAP
jgi:copper chaperone CopZ